MKKKSMKRFMVLAVAMCGTMFQLGGCINFNRILASTVDHVAFEFLEPFIGSLTGALTGETE